MTMYRYIFLFWLVVLMGGVACRFPSTGKAPQQARFFDLTEYFNAEIKRLQTLNPQVDKSVSLLNKPSENNKVTIGDWHTELSFFIQSDINRPVWWEKYSVDSLFDEQKQLSELRYEAKAPELRTRKLDIKFKNNQVQSILIVNYIQNTLYTTQEFLEYLPQQGYTVAKKQDVVLYNENDYKVEANWGS